MKFNKWDYFYIKMTKLLAEDLSSALRYKVGCVIVRDKNILAYGYNGTASGFDNNCEFTDGDGNLKTKPEVIHAEINAIAKAAKLGIPLMGSDLYVTISPCIECAKLIIQCGVVRVFFVEKYRDLSGLELLKKADIECFQIQ